MSQLPDEGNLVQVARTYVVLLFSCEILQLRYKYPSLFSSNVA